MRRWKIYFVTLIAIAAWNVPGFVGSDVGKYVPVEAVRVSRQNGMILIETDTGDSGSGMDTDLAIADLIATTPGIVFLETADYIIVQQGCEDLLRDLQCHLRPSCGVCIETQRTNPEDAAQYLRAHELAVTLQDWESGAPCLPKLVVKGERVELE